MTPDSTVYAITVSRSAVEPLGWALFLLLLFVVGMTALVRCTRR